MVDYARICNPYAEFDDQDTDDEDERDEDKEDLNHQKKIVQLGKGRTYGPRRSAKDTGDDPLQKAGVHVEKGLLIRKLNQSLPRRKKQ